MMQDHNILYHNDLHFDDIEEMSRQVFLSNRDKEELTILWTFFRRNPEGIKLWAMIERVVFFGKPASDSGMPGLIGFEAIRQFFLVIKDEMDKYEQELRSVKNG